MNAKKIKPSPQNCNLKNHNNCCIMADMSLTDEIKQKAIESGFDLVGITDASPIPPGQFEHFAAWLASGFAGRMEYLHRNPDKRFRPTELLENAKSVIVVGLNYKPSEQKTVPISKHVPTGKIVSYACYEDYHSFIKKRLNQLTEFISSTSGQALQFRICVDSEPLAERALAVRAGLGFIGKNHMLINPTLGCQIFLGEIITDLKLPLDKQVTRDCATCQKCIDICPTGALRPDGQFDAGRCINYLTIEYKDEIPPDLASIIGDRLFGCEECILACPYHKNAPACKNTQFKFYPDRAIIELREILNLNNESFEAKFAASVIKRAGLDRLRRNARICLMNIRP
jgi:epoxyqueuosine reductase